MDTFGDLLQSMLDGEDGFDAFGASINDPAISFGPVDAPYTFAAILPERISEDNEINASALRFHSIIANASDRYSPPQFKSAVEGVSLGARLADSNAAFRIKADLVETITLMLRRGQTVQAVSAMLRAFERGVVKPLTDLAELWRVQAVVNANVVAVGMNGISESIPYTNPTGSRVTIAAQWSDPAIDPMPDIQAGDTYLRAHGYRATRAVAGSDTVRILASNPKMIARAVAIQIIETSGVNGTTLTSTPMPGRMSVAQLNQVLANENLPPIEVDDGVYNTSTTRGVFFYPRGGLTLLGSTAQQEDIVDTSGEVLRTLTNTLGFTGIGRVVAQPAPGRVYQNLFEDRIPPFAEFTGFQTMLPVIEWEDAIYHMGGIH